MSKVSNRNVQNHQEENKQEHKVGYQVVSGSGVQAQRFKQYGINIVYRFFVGRRKNDRIIRMPSVTESDISQDEA